MTGPGPDDEHPSPPGAAVGVGPHPGPWPDDPRLDPSLAGVQVQSDGYEKARAAYRAAASALADSRDRLGHLEQDLAELGTERGRLEAELADARARNDAARAEFDRHRASLRSLAVESYVQGRGSVADDLAGRLAGLFLPGPDGVRPSDTGSRFATDPRWNADPTFSEYFHGDTGAGLGASHQTGWTALVAHLLLTRHADDLVS